MLHAAAARWADENVGFLHLDRDAQGRRIVIETAPIIAINTDWFRTHGWQDMFMPDGTLHLDEAGMYRYRRVRDLPGGRTAYERIEEA